MSSPAILPPGHPFAAVADLLNSHILRVHELRKANGFHDKEADKWRQEKWNLTAAKLLALTDFSRALAEMPVPQPAERDTFRDYLAARLASHREPVEPGIASDPVKASLLESILKRYDESRELVPPKRSLTAETPDLTGEKPALSLRRFVVESIAHHTAEAEYYSSRHMYECGSRHRAQANAIAAILDKFSTLSGNAEEQPGPGEEPPQPKERAAAATPFDSAEPWPWLRYLPTEALSDLSETILEALAARGESPEWKLKE